MNNIVYDPAIDALPIDKFGPIADGPCLQLPNHCQVRFISSVHDVQLLKSLIGKEMVGMDSEWRPTMTKFDNMRPALLQLSDENNAYLIDLVSLASNPVLDDVLS